MHKTRFRLYLKRTRSAIVDLHKSRCLICFALATLLPNTTRYDELVGVCNGCRFGQVRQAGCNPKKLHGISNKPPFPQTFMWPFFHRTSGKNLPIPFAAFDSINPSCHAVQRWRPLPWPPGEKWWKIHGKWIVLDWWRLRGLPKNIEIFSIESIGDRESSTHFPENKVISKPVCFDHPFQMQLVWTGRCHVERDVAPISSALLPLVALDSSCKTWRL